LTKLDVCYFWKHEFLQKLQLCFTDHRIAIFVPSYKRNKIATSVDSSPKYLDFAIPFQILILNFKNCDPKEIMLFVILVKKLLLLNAFENFDVCETINKLAFFYSIIPIENLKKKFEFTSPY